MWTKNPPILKLAVDVLQMRVRLERMHILKKLKVAEAQTQEAGVPPELTDKYRQYTRDLMRAPLLPVKPVFKLRALVVKYTRRDF